MTGTARNNVLISMVVFLFAALLVATPALAILSVKQPAPAAAPSQVLPVPVVTALA